MPVFESETINGTVYNYTYEEDIQACNLTSEADDLVCVEDVMYQLDNSVRNCTCRPNCQELDYEVYISQSQWPSKFYQVCSLFLNLDFSNLNQFFVNNVETFELIYSLHKSTWSDLPTNLPTHINCNVKKNSLQ